MQFLQLHLCPRRTAASAKPISEIQAFREWGKAGSLKAEVPHCPPTPPSGSTARLFSCGRRAPTTPRSSRAGPTSSSVPHGPGRRPGEKNAVIDPAVSFDAEWVYYSLLRDVKAATVASLRPPGRHLQGARQVAQDLQLSCPTILAARHRMHGRLTPAIRDVQWDNIEHLFRPPRPGRGPAVMSCAKSSNLVFHDSQWPRLAFAAARFSSLGFGLLLLLNVARCRYLQEVHAILRVNFQYSATGRPRRYATPASLIVIVSNPEVGGKRGYDAGKTIKGRKRHLPCHAGPDFGLWQCFPPPPTWRIVMRPNRC